MIEIEKNVPMPARRSGPGSGAKYPFKEMEVGDSFLANKQVTNAAQNHKQRYPGWSYSARKMPDGTLRIWRTA